MTQYEQQLKKFNPALIVVAIVALGFGGLYVHEHYIKKPAPASTAPQLPTYWWAGTWQPEEGSVPTLRLACNAARLSGDLTLEISGGFQARMPVRDRLIADDGPLLFALVSPPTSGDREPPYYLLQPEGEGFATLYRLKGLGAAYEAVGSGGSLVPQNPEEHHEKIATLRKQGGGVSLETLNAPDPQKPPAK